MLNQSELLFAGARITYLAEECRGLRLVCSLSRWNFLKPCLNSNLDVVLQSSLEVISSCGCPRSIITDTGSVFAGKAMRDFVEEFGIEHCTTTTYMPATNRMCGRVYQEIKFCFVRIIPNNCTDVS